MRIAPLVLLAACGNDLPPPGSCAVQTSAEAPAVDTVALVGQSASFDDLRYSPSLGRVVAVPEGTGRLFLVDPDSLAVTSGAVPGGSASADADGSTVYVADRGNNSIVSVDAATFAQTHSHALGEVPDYVRVALTAPEVWVTLPGPDRIDVLDAATLAPVTSIAISGPPEGLTFDAGGKAYTQSEGRVVVIDVASHRVIGEFGSGCGASHGFPQVDDAYGLLVAGCRANGGIDVLTANGDERAGFEAGGGAAILAYDEVRHHLYVRGDPGTTLDILATCSDGGTSVLAKVAITNNGHGATADDRGHAWVADETSGGVLRITDPFSPPP